MPVRIPFPFGRSNQGFICDIIQGPVWDACLPALFKGVLPPHVLVGPFRTRYDDNLGRDAYPYVRIEAVDSSRCDTRAVLDTVLYILALFRSAAIGSCIRYHRHLPIITSICDACLRLCDMRVAAAQKGREFAELRGMYSRLQRMVGDIRSFGRVNLQGHWFGRLQKMRFGSALASRVTSPEEVLRLLRIECPDCDVHDAVDALAGCSVQGHAISVHRTGASEIDPWLIIVNSVSHTTRVSVADVYKSGEFSIGNARDVLLINAEEPLPPTLHMMVLAYTFTRNPFIGIKAQSPALLVSCWVCVGESLYTACRQLARSQGKSGKSPTANQQQQVLERLRFFRELSHHVRSLPFPVLPSEWWVSFSTSTEPAVYLLSEREGVHSLLQVLAVLLQRNIAPHSLPLTFSFAILAEAVGRAARAAARSASSSANPQLLIQQLLRVSSAGAEGESFTSDMGILAARTARFYRARYTNTSPQAVIGVLGLMQCMFDGESDADIAAKLLCPSSSLSMLSFLHRHHPSLSSHAATSMTVALYLEGLSHNGHASPEGYSDPESIVSRHILADIDRIRAKNENLHSRTARDRARLQRLLDAAAGAKLGHTHPRLFTSEEIRILNLKRAANDQLELMESGLLKFHCCYPVRGGSIIIILCVTWVQVAAGF